MSLTNGTRLGPYEILSPLGAATRMETAYTYDIEDATLYGSANNRLMMYIEERVVADPPPGTGETRTLLATTFYYYNNEGNVTRVVTQKANPAPGEPMYSATRMAYALNGRAVTFVMGETWNDNMCPPTGYTVTYAREFRYDSAHQRYLNRELDPAVLQHPGDIIALSSKWTDFDGAYGYGDFTVAGVASERRAFIPGVAMVDPWTAAGGASTKYFHTNLIERLWGHLKRTVIANVLFFTVDDLVAAFKRGVRAVNTKRNKMGFMFDHDDVNGSMAA